MNILVTKADPCNFRPDSLDTFDRFQTVTNVFRQKYGELVLEYHPFTETWSAERKREKAAEILSGAFLTYCAWDDGHPVGEIMLIPELDHGRLIVDSLHVSLPYRRLGIGRMLLKAAREEGEKRGATALYASACSAEETIRFYLAMGFAPSRQPIPRLAMDEPWDIQMELPLSADFKYPDCCTS